MSLFHKELRDYVVTHFMSLSVNREPVKNEEFVDEEQVLDEAKGEPVVPVESGPKYYYLDDDPLSYEFSLDRDLTKTYTLHLVLYKINQVLPLPFLEFYLKSFTTEFQFPHRVLLPEVFSDVDQDDERLEPMDTEKGSDNVDDVFLDQCKQFFAEVTGSPPASLESIYKGFIEKDNHIFIVANGSELAGIENLGTEGAWATLDEILRTKTMLGLPITPLVVDLFLENKVLIHIKNEDRENLPLPQVLYLCQKQDQIVENVYYAGHEPTSIPALASLIHERTEHPTLKHIYLFSEEILSQEASPLHIKRYALFVDAANRFDPAAGEPVHVEPVVGFSENGVNYWAAKSPKYFAEL